MNKRLKGKLFEDLAVEYLVKKGYKVVERNFHCSFGEIDIIAKKDEVLCFIEVKARSSKNFGSSLESITVYKQKKIMKVAEFYMMKNKIYDKPLRFEAIGVDISNDPPLIEHIENIFY